MCLEYARPFADERLFWAIQAREDHGTSALIYIGDVPPEPFVPPVVTVQDAASALDVELPVPTADTLRAALAGSVDNARYWQEPDGADLLAAEPGMRESLERIATVLAASPAARWWDSGIALDDQWTTPWEGAAVDHSGTEAALGAWRDELIAEEERAAVERPIDPTARWSGTWWSRPPWNLVRSTRGLGDAGPAGLWFVEDSLGWEAASATPLHPASADVLEIDGPDAWIELCRRHPLIVTASRRHDWYRVTGWTGEWVQPDWAAVAREVDGVHLTVGAYLRSATRLLEVGDGRASVIAGWDPDATFWFGRTLPAGPTEDWEWVHDDWRRSRGPSSGDSV
ncbi:hypothetical protein GCM10009775_27910 [Microbacterium aoyamense]|uniref:Uncharacterized protein n=2 Tax=Microbacterium aoyamense TaxID=344166 RepID=A0ABN2PWH7_9MICO